MLCRAMVCKKAHLVGHDVPQAITGQEQEVIVFSTREHSDLHIIEVQKPAVTFRFVSCSSGKVKWTRAGLDGRQQLLAISHMDQSRPQSMLEAHDVTRTMQVMQLGSVFLILQ
jgi:hypothetical protein